MENQINIDEIIEYLDKDNNLIKNTFNDENYNLNYLENYNSINFKKFNNFFKDNIDRIGIPKNDKSIFFSI